MTTANVQAFKTSQGFNSISIVGRRWFQRSYGNTLSLIHTRHSNGSYNTPNWSEREALGIHHHAIDVNRKKDL